MIAREEGYAFPSSRATRHTFPLSRHAMQHVLKEGDEQTMLASNRRLRGNLFAWVLSHPGESLGASACALGVEARPLGAELPPADFFGQLVSSALTRERLGGGRAAENKQFVDNFSESDHGFLHWSLPRFRRGTVFRGKDAPLLQLSDPQRGAEKLKRGGILPRGLACLRCKAALI